MAAARVALAFIVVASAVQTGGAEPCAPRAELGGDAEAVARVAIELKRLGVEAVDGAGPGAPRATSCPTVVAAVELDPGGGIAVAVRDGSQRSEGRVMSDAALAAAWIDSWLRDGFVVPRAEMARPAAPAPVIGTVATAPQVPVLAQFSLAASLVQAWSDDSTRWTGVAALACLRTGALCIGGRVGYATQQVAANQSAAMKRDLSVLATASYSHDVGRMSLAPELGLGVGRLTTARVEGCKAIPVMCDPMTDPGCDAMTPSECPADPTPLAYVGDGFTATTFTPRVSAALRIAIPLFDHVWLDGLAAATLAPFGHAGDYAANTDDGTTMPNTTGAFPLPGDPLLGVQLGIGLRVGAR